MQNRGGNLGCECWIFAVCRVVSAGTGWLFLHLLCYLEDMYVASRTNIVLLFDLLTRLI